MLACGGDALSTEELLALVLGSGTRGRPADAVARELLASAGGVAALSRAAPRELLEVAGVGQARAARVAAAFYLGRRGMAQLGAQDAALLDAEGVFRRLQPRLGGLAQEVFVVLALDARHRVLAELEVARGHLTGVDVHPREVFRPLIRQAAAAAVIAHNHPSGDPSPSAQDVALTLRLQAVGELVGIPILDHVIVTTNRFVSLVEHLPTLSSAES